jgi:hypothetical protein
LSVEEVRVVYEYEIPIFFGFKQKVIEIPSSKVIGEFPFDQDLSISLNPVCNVPREVPKRIT